MQFKLHALGMWVLAMSSEAAEFDFLAKSTWKWGTHKMV